MSRLDGRRVLVTGASSGIGEATARAIAAEGGQVAVLARSADRLRELASELGGVDVSADVTDVASVRRGVDRAAEALGGLDAVVNSAGVVRPGSIADADPDDWRIMFDVNVIGLLAVTQATIPHLRSSEAGHVINLSSMSGRRLASPATTVYSGTKFAVHVISEGLRQELMDDGIRVTIVAPGFVDTPIFDGVADDETRARYQEAAASKGLTAEQVADQIVNALAAPPDVAVFEVAILSMRQLT